MSGVSIFIISVICALIFSSIFSKIYKDKEKVDKGFEISYFKLTYRRKMLRTLTGFPFFIAALFIIYYFSSWSLAAYITFVILALLSLFIQFIYNYKMWKKEERKFH
ncbi:ATPase [Cytobacillus suaedae]|nr:ATPase [Cytobacillus suaedae]